MPTWSGRSSQCSRPPSASGCNARWCASSRTAFDIAETRLREGTVDLVTVLNTQQTLFQAQDVLAQAQFDRLAAAVSLFQALGGGWQKPKEDGPASTVKRPPKP